MSDYKLIKITKEKGNKLIGMFYNKKSRRLYYGVVSLIL